MQIVFSLGHVFYPGADEVENASVLRNTLEYLTRINVDYLRSCHEHGHPAPPLYKSGVTYGRTTWWEAIPDMYARGFGDCKSLTCALVAEYRMAGIWCRPAFRFNPRADGHADYHILVQLRKGWEDPSRRLGMGSDENAPSIRLLDPLAGGYIT